MVQIVEQVEAQVAMHSVRQAVAPGRAPGAMMAVGQAEEQAVAGAVVGVVGQAVAPGGVPIAMLGVWEDVV